MELLVLPSSVLVASIIIFFFLKISKSSKNPNNLPPGPWKLPLIGSLHHLVGSLTHHALRDLAKTHGPLIHLKLGEISAVVASSPDAVREITKTHDVNFSSRPSIIAAKYMTYDGADLLFAPYGDYWRQLRKLCVVELLSAKRVQSFSAIREDEVMKLVRALNGMGPSSPINISLMLHSLTADVTARAAFGNECKDKNTFLVAMREALKYGSGFSLADLFPSLPLLRLLSGIDSKLGRLHQNVDRVLNSIIEEHKEWRSSKASDTEDQTDVITAEENLLDVLLNLQERNDSLGFPLTTTTIKGIIFDVFQAGSGSSSSTMSWAMSELIRNPRVMKKAQSEVRQSFSSKDKITDNDIEGLGYLKLVVKEALRLHPPAPMLVPRECTERCEIFGYQIPSKTRVIINAWAIGRDPEHWEDADEFKPERFEGRQIDFKGGNFEYIPFGAGRRMCPGISFGTAMMEMALAHLLFHFEWSLPDGMKPEQLDMTESPGLAARRKKDLLLRATPYTPTVIAN